jgi:ornithine racemase
LINTKKIRHNTKTIVEISKKVDITIFGVTKATCGDTKIAEEMIKGGVAGIADSRLDNIKEMTKQKICTDFMHLRTPMSTEIKDVVKYADISLNTETKIIQKLSEGAVKQGKKHKIILMVEMGDLREGIPPKELDDVIQKIKKLAGVKIYGIGMNLACFGGVVPTQEKISKFLEIVEKTEKKHNINFEMISGGNSANIPLLLEKSKKTKINNLRIGEAILLGLETVNRTAIPDTYQDAFILEAEIIEYKQKESKPCGKITQNAFGETPEYEDIGKINRAIIAVGKQDTIPNDLIPLDKDIEILGSSSDHILLHLKNNKYSVGDIVKFKPRYGALVGLYTSKYVTKKYI